MVEAPDVVEVEGDEAENGEVEEDFPSRDQAAITVQGFTPIVPFRWRDRREDACERVASTQFICKEYSNVENPCSSWHLFPLQLGGEIIVDVEYDEYFCS